MTALDLQKKTPWKNLSNTAPVCFNQLSNYSCPAAHDKLRAKASETGRDTGKE